MVRTYLDYCSSVWLPYKRWYCVPVHGRHSWMFSWKVFDDIQCAHFHCGMNCMNCIDCYWLFYFTVQKLDLSADVQKKYPHYSLYFYGEGYVWLLSPLHYMCITQFMYIYKWLCNTI